MFYHYQKKKLPGNNTSSMRTFRGSTLSDPEPLTSPSYQEVQKLNDRICV